MTVFARPTQDAVAKYLFDDEEIRNSFIRAMTPYKDIVSSVKIDNALRPLRVNQNLLSIIQDDVFLAFLENHSNLPSSTEAEKLSRRFYRNFYENIEEIQAALLDPKGPVSDVVCTLQTGEYVLIEVQVIDPGQYTWDKRALMYASMLFSNQLRRGQDWWNLRDLMAINILGMGKENRSSFWPKGSHYKRHYCYQDQLSGRLIEAVQLIQYSLGNTNIDDVKDEEEQAWLDFFKNAHEYDSVPHNSSRIMKMAYKRIAQEYLPPNIKDLYKTEEEHLLNYTEKFEQGH